MRKHPILKFDRGKEVRIRFNGREIKAYENEAIAAALYAAGVRVFSRSFRYHRPRGFFCAIGKCSTCLMRVNGVPNVRTCVTPVEDGMVIEAQKGFPSVEHDVLSAIDRFSSFFRAGVQWHSFIRPSFSWSVAQRAIRSLSGVGKLPTPSTPTIFLPSQSKDVDVAVVGGGPAGISAALFAAKLGVRVALIDENSKLGGQLVKQTHRFFGSEKYFAGKRGIEIANILSDEVKRTDNIEPLLNSSVFGIYDKGKKLGVVKRMGLKKERLIKIRAKQTIIATGGYERTLIFENNDLPGVMGAGGVQTLMNVYGVKPGNRALIIGAGNVGLILSYQLLQAGVEVKAIVEAMPHAGGYFVHASKVRRLGVPIFTSHTILRASGKKRVEGATITQLDEKWRPMEGTEKDIKADLIVIAVGLNPDTRLLGEAGSVLKFVKELGGFVAFRSRHMETDVEGVYIAGDVSGIEEASTAILEGRMAGLSAGLNLGVVDERAEGLREEAMEELDEFRRNPIGERIRKGIGEVIIR